MVTGGLTNCVKLTTLPTYRSTQLGPTPALSCRFQIKMAVSTIGGRVYSLHTVAVTSNEKRWRRTAKPQSKKGIRRPNSTKASIQSQHMKRVRMLMLLGGKCEVCNNNDMRVLHIDHINNNGAKERREFGRGTVPLFKRVMANPFDYQILCANCHEIKHAAVYAKEA